MESLRFSESDLYYYYGRDGQRRHVPGKTGFERHWSGQGRAAFRINSLGLRGPEIQVPKPVGVFRVLLLGDSITLGGRLPEEETFASRLERLLAPEKAETINAGVGDVGLREEERLLGEVGPRVETDLLLLCWYLNDARPPQGFPEEVVYRNPLVRWIEGQEWLQGSYLAGFLYDRLRRFLVARRLASLEGTSRRFDWIKTYQEGTWARDPAAFERLVEEARFDWGDAWSDDSLRWTAGRILALRGWARSRGARFAIAAFPEHAQVYAPAGRFVDKPQKALGAFAKDNGIPFLDLLEPLRPRRSEPLFYDNCHYTPRGNAVVAEALAGFLRREGLLARSGKS